MMKGFPTTGPAALAALAVLMGAAPVLAAAQNGAVVITTDPPGGVVYVDGERAGAAPLKRELMGGDHLVEIKWADGRSASQVVTVVAGSSSVVKLTPTAAAPAPPAPPGGATPPAASPSAPAAPSASPPLPAAPPSASAAPAAPSPATPPAETPPPAPPPPPPASPSAAPSQGEAATSPPPAASNDRAVAQIPDQVPSPALPHRLQTIGAGLALGVNCDAIGVNNQTNAGGCGLAVRFVPVDISIGQLQIDYVAGESGGSGGRFGFALGSKFFPVGGPATPVALAIRGQAAFLYQSTPQDPNNSDFYGPQLGALLQVSYAATRLIAIDGSIAGGVEYVNVDENPSFVNYAFGGSNGFGGYFQLLAGVRL
jgi:hypothetical protein